MSIDKYVAEVVATWPPPTPAQIESAARILSALPAKAPDPDGPEGGA